MALQPSKRKVTPHTTRLKERFEAGLKRRAKMPKKTVCRYCRHRHPPDTYVALEGFEYMVCPRCQKYGVPDTTAKTRTAVLAVDEGEIGQAKVELAARELARRNLIHFVQRFVPHYKAGWVHYDICRRLERFAKAVAAGKSPRLLLLMPPRHGKSELASKKFPAWYLGHYPHHELILASYNLSLPTEFSRAVRDVIRDEAYKVLFKDTKLSQDSQSVETWKTTVGGGLLAVGVGGGLTGKGANVLIIDDPIKNWEEADSGLIRAALWNWYVSTAYTRLAPGGGVLLIQTCWNDDDLAGRIQLAMKEDPEADQFEVVKYPAINEGYDEYLDKDDRILTVMPGVRPEGAARLLRPANSALHADRYNLDQLVKIRNTMSREGNARIWSALYQQNPVPDEGAFFQRAWFRKAQVAPVRKRCYCYQAWDFAITTKQTSDWTVGVTILVDELDDVYVVEVTRFRSDDSSVIADAVLDAWARWQPDALGVEDGQIWKALRASFEKRAQERRLYPSYEPLTPLSDKMARAQPLRGRLQLGKVYVMSEHYELVLSEMIRFPAGAHDDLVDALSWAVRLTLGKGPPPPLVRPLKLKSWKDGLSRFTEGGGGGHMAA